VIWQGKKFVRVTIRMTEAEKIALQQIGAPKDLTISFIARKYLRAAIERQRKHCPISSDKARRTEIA